MTDELLDLYSASGTPLGRAKPRSAVHRDGDWHKTFHCWMCYRGEAGQEMLILQKRSPHVETWPNRFDITAAGHYRTGEDLSGGVRELEGVIKTVGAMARLSGEMMDASRVEELLAPARERDLRPEPDDKPAA